MIRHSTRVSQSIQIDTYSYGYTPSPTKKKNKTSFFSKIVDVVSPVPPPKSHLAPVEILYDFIA